MRAFFSAVMIFAGWMACASTSMAGVILAGGIFSGRIDRWDTTTNTVSTFSDIQSSINGPGIVGIAYNPVSNRVIVAARFTNQILELDSSTGAIVAQHASPNISAPAGIAIDAAGNIYVANNGGNTLSRFRADFASETTIVLPDFGAGDNLPSGVAITASGNVLISTFAGVGVINYDPTNGSFASFNSSNPLANGMMTIDGTGKVSVGGAAFTSTVSQFDAAGNAVGSITIDSALLPQPPAPYASPDFTSPSGVAIDGSGNLIVGALGRTNPFSQDDNFQSNGGLFLFDSTGALITSLVQTTPYSSVAYFSAVPEPTSLLALGAGLSAIGLVRRRRAKRSEPFKVSNPS